MRGSRIFADVSAHQAAVDMREYHRKGGHLAIALKATEGETYTDPKYAARAREARAEGLIKLHYHFARPDTRRSATKEAQHFWNTVKPHFCKHDRLVIDVEVGSNTAEILQFLRQFDRVLRRLSGRKPILYTYAAFLPSAGRLARSNSWWIAAYTSKMVKPSWLKKGAWAWQYTDGTAGNMPHRSAGIGRCDLSILNRATWRRWRLTTGRSRRKLAK